MSEAKHTPGPWTYDDRWSQVLDQSGRRILLTGVALTTGNHPSKTEAEANDRLIAAAPDLLAELKSLVSALENVVAPIVLVGAKAAIAKAEGGGK